MIIREATIEDAEALEETEKLCFTEPWSPAVIKSCFLSKNTRMLAAKEENSEKLSGYVCFFRVLDEGNIDKIAVRPEFRRNGLGRTLLREALDRMEKDGVIKVFLEVRAGNEPARLLYESEGFTLYGKRKDYYQSPTEDACLYVREKEISAGRKEKE